jgi:hypothetical protein
VMIAGALGMREHASPPPARDRDEPRSSTESAPQTVHMPQCWEAKDRKHPQTVRMPPCWEAEDRKHSQTVRMPRCWEVARTDAEARAALARKGGVAMGTESPFAVNLEAILL